MELLYSVRKKVGQHVLSERLLIKATPRRNLLDAGAVRIDYDNCPMQEILKTFWQSYLDSLPSAHSHRLAALPFAWSFGDSAEMADQLAQLVLDGKKTATCSRYLQTNILEDSGLSILLSGEDEPLCVLETFELRVIPYDQVTAEFAAQEGEGDLSLDYWRTEHWTFFSREAKTEGYEVSETMPLLCERFRVLFKAEP